VKPAVPPDSTTPADTSAPSLLQVGGGVGQLRGVAICALAERAERARERGSLRRQPRQTKQHRVGDAAWHDRADIVRGGRGGMDAASRQFLEQLADEEGVAARHVEARAGKPPFGLIGQPGGDQCADGRLCQGGHSSSARRIGRAPLPRAPAWDQAAGRRG
jgi:hypothetical protein